MSLIGGVAYGSSTYGQGSGPILFDYMFCSGNEDSLIDCYGIVFSVPSSSCSNHYYDLGLKCERKRFNKSLLIVIYLVVFSLLVVLYATTVLIVCYNFK